MIPRHTKREYKYIRASSLMFNETLQTYANEGWTVDKFIVDANDWLHVIFTRLVYV